MWHETCFIGASIEYISLFWRENDSMRVRSGRADEN